MKFNDKERQLLLDTPYVGPVVIQRFEEVGINNFKKLSKSSVEQIATIVGDNIGSNCWKNSWQSKRSIQNAINTAIENLGK
jgi:hypothetical protein